MTGVQTCALPISEQLFREKARACQSEILFADQHYMAKPIGHEVHGKANTRIYDIYRDGERYLEALASPLTGLYQRKNIATVMAVCEVLKRTVYALSKDSVRKGIANVVKTTGLAGRWQVLATEPLTICDTGHNEGGLKEVLAQIDATPHRHLHFVFGVVNDKHLDPILDLMPKNATYYFCKPDIPRGLDPFSLQQQSQAREMYGECYPSVKAALASARNSAGKEDLVFVGGSTFVVAEVV